MTYTYREFLIEVNARGFKVFHTEGSTSKKVSGCLDEVDMLDNAKDFVDNLYTT